MGCKKLTVISLSKGILGSGKPKISFDFNGFHIAVTDCGARTTEITSESEVEPKLLRNVFQKVYTLGAIGEGYVYKIEKAAFSDSTTDSPEALERCVKKFMEKELFKMESDFFGATLILLPFQCYATSEVLQRWVQLYDELKYPHNAFLYMTHLKGLPIDMRLAYMTECFEPLAQYDARIHDRKIPKNDTRIEWNTLIDYLHYIFNIYGKMFFRRERKGDYNTMVSKLADNRHRLFHLRKGCKKEKRLSKIELAVFSRKLHLLYRHTLLQLLGIDYSLYKDKLRENINNWNTLYDREEAID
jgi:hypothetical protein